MGRHGQWKKIDTLLSASGLHLTLNKKDYPNGERDLTKFRFNGVNITDPKGTTDRITSVSIDQSILTIQREKGLPLYFQKEEVIANKIT